MRKRKLLCTLLTTALVFTSTDFTVLAIEKSDVVQTEQSEDTGFVEETEIEESEVLSESEVTTEETGIKETETTVNESETDLQTEALISEETKEAETETVTEAEETEVETEIRTEQISTEDINLEEVIIEEVDALTEGEGTEISTNTVLDADTEYDNLTIKSGGTLDLNGHTVTVKGDLNYSGGTLNINNGTLDVKGEAVISNGIDLAGGTVRIDGNVLHTDGTINFNKGTLSIIGDYRCQTKVIGEDNSVSYGNSNGWLRMLNAEDVFEVKGDFYYQEDIYNPYANNLNAGTMKLGGDFTRIKGTNNNRTTFYSVENHKIILNGTEEQKISFANANSNSCINELEFQNKNVTITTPVYINKLVSDGKLRSEGNGGIANIDLNGHNLEITGDISIGIDYSNVDLNQGMLKVDGNVLHTNGTISFNKGTLSINGDYRCQTKNIEEDNSISYGDSYGKLWMTNIEDLFEVKGDFYIQEDDYYKSSNLTAGTMKLGGDFTQIKGNVNNRSDFCSEEAHRIILNGINEQKISFANANYHSGINELELQNDNVTITTPVAIKKLVSDGKIKSEDKGGLVEIDLNGHILEVTGDLVITGSANYAVDLNKGTLKVDGNVFHTDYYILFNKGCFEIEGDYRCQTKNIEEDNSISYGDSYGKLWMTNIEDLFEVKGDFYIQEDDYYKSSNLTAGTMKLGGNFTQIKGTTNNQSDFRSEEAHRIILNGTKNQKISFANANYNSGINELELQNDNVTITTPIDIKKLVSNGKIKSEANGAIAGIDLNEHTLEVTENVGITGNIKLNKGTLNITGNVLHTAGTITADGTMLIDGNYTSETTSTDKYGVTSVVATSAKIVMDKDFSKVDITGDYNTFSTSSTFTAGVLTIGGDITDRYTGSNFFSSGTHKLVLNGTDKQSISFADANDCINEIEFKNENIVLKSPIRITKLLTDAKLTSENGIISLIDLNKHNLEITGNVEIAGNIALTKGTLTINGDVFHTAGKITADGTMNINGNYKSAKWHTDEYGEESLVTTDASIEMNKDFSQVNITGNFNNNSSGGTYVAGVLAIGGNIEDLCSGGNFACSGTHRLVLNGQEEQTISFSGTSDCINELELLNENITVASPIKINKLVSDGKIKSNGATILGLDLNKFTLDITGDVIIEGDIKLTKGTLNIIGNVLHTSGAITADGAMTVTGNYEMAKYEKNEYDEIVKVPSTASFVMDTDISRIEITGDFSNYSSDSGIFTAGTLKLGGHLEDLYDGANFVCSGTHTVILNGEQAQSVTFKGSGDKINNLVITKDMSNYTFNPNPCWVNINQSGMYTITFKLGINNETVVIDKVVEGEAIGEDRLPKLPEREGYTFAGWYTDSDGRGEAVTAETIVTSDLIVYAYWQTLEEEEIKVTFDFGDGYELHVTEPILNGEIIGADRMPKIPEKEGYVFVGWFTQKDGKGEAVTANTVVTGSFTAYAYWKEFEEEAKIWIQEIAPQEYTGKAIKPEVKVYYGAKLLKEKTDYTIKYLNNTKAANKTSAKAPTVKVTGKGDYEGTALVKFDILQKDISDNKDITLEFEDAYLYKAGNAQKIKPVLKFGSKTLKSGDSKDYVIKCVNSKGMVVDYKKIVDEGNYILIVTGVNNFTGSIERKFSVSQKIVLSKLTFSKLNDLKYTGDKLTQKITIIDKTKNPAYTLVEGIDYSVRFENNTEVGKAYAYVSALSGSEYFGSKYLYFNVIGTPINSVTINNMPQTVSYTGDRIKPEPELYMNGSKLTKNTDYELVYGENINKGTGTVTVRGKGAYSGTVVKKFKIEASDISLVTFKDSNIVAGYTKGGAKPANLNLFYNGTKLVEGVDYKLSYKNNKKLSAGSSKAPTIVIKGIGNYKGSISKTFTIVKKDLADTNVTVSDVAYTGKAGIYTPKAVVYDTDDKKLKAGTDYDKNVSYFYKENTIVTDAATNSKVERKAGDSIQKNDIIDIGTVLAAAVVPLGNYTGEPVVVEYRVVKYHINDTNVNSIVKEYTGKAIELTKEDIQMTLKTGSNKVLDSQFEIVEGSYRNNIKKGKATVTVRGVGDFGGTKTITFKIKAKSLF